MPTISINEPSNNTVVDAACVDVWGTFAVSNLKQITVSGVQTPSVEPAIIRGNMFEARTIGLAPGTNIISAIIEDQAGNKATNLITLLAPNDSGVDQTMPVQIHIGPVSGFVPLPVTISVKAHVPGQIQKVIYYFNGDNIPDQTNSDLQPVTHVYNGAGDFFPVVTIETTVARFSSLSGMLGLIATAYGGGDVLASVNVHAKPVVLSTLKIADPVDIKWTATSNLYVLSGSTATITEFDANGKLLRSISGIGTNPTGLEVDDQGNVYVTAPAGNKLLKLKPTASSFEANVGSSTDGVVGSRDGGTDNRGRYVADAKNNCLQVFAPEDRGGELRVSISNELGLNHPKAVAAVADFLEERFYVADTGNNRVILVKLPLDNPESVWKHMTTCLKEDDIAGALSDFSVASKDQYQQAFQAIPKQDLISSVKDMENIKPVTIESDQAQYYFESMVDGTNITSPVEFGKELGQWKIKEF